jgi:murein DD-endopeptidase MepM/ murein hydrolase activator NlpD
MPPFAVLVFVCALGLPTAAPPPALISLTLKDSVEASLVRVLPKEGQSVAAQVARLLRWRGDINRVLHPGDSLALVYAQDGLEPELVAMHYVGSQIQLQAFRFAPAGGIPRYYDAEGQLIEPEMVDPPVADYVQITELVQHGRGKRKHRGIDLKAPEGSPIRLPFAGTVRRTNWSRRSNGNCIEMALANGRIAHFLHMARLDPQVKRGAALPAGTVLGTVGNTGHSNAAHLHYEILANGRPLEPLDVHGRRVGHLPAADMPSFRRMRDAYLRQLRGPAMVPEQQLASPCGGDAADVPAALCRPTAP